MFGCSKYFSTLLCSLFLLSLFLFLPPLPACPLLTYIPSLPPLILFSSLPYLLSSILLSMSCSDALYIFSSCLSLSLSLSNCNNNDIIINPLWINNKAVAKIFGARRANSFKFLQQLLTKAFHLLWDGTENLWAKLPWTETVERHMQNCNLVRVNKSCVVFQPPRVYTTKMWDLVAWWLEGGSIPVSLKFCNKHQCRMDCPERLRNWLQGATLSCPTWYVLCTITLHCTVCTNSSLHLNSQCHVLSVCPSALVSAFHYLLLTAITRALSSYAPLPSLGAMAKILGAHFSNSHVYISAAA